MATAVSLSVIWNSIARAISKASSKPFVLDQKSTLSGGSINHAYRISGGNQHYFVKLNRADNLAMFEAEMAGLHELAAAQAIRVPQPICTGAAADQSWLVTEYIELGNGRGESAQCLGRQLADLHRCQSEQFGWFRDNTIGSTPQHNTWTDDWLEFYREQRLSVQFELAAKNGFTGSLQHKGERLMANLGAFFSTYQAQPCLLHGDLWGGNCAFDVGGDPVIFDPAVYYGDREADMAMTELFGGFSAHFYAAYTEAWPLDAGYAVRKTLYNLYHILNHVNLFGATYAAQAEAMTDRLLAEIG
ncbi:MAG: fructosamine kinase family protein [Mariprofundus sp.]|nr:fructosamine kinase family protein [Mariprofundus sp.]